MSMFGVNSGVPKTVVRKVCKWWANRNVKCKVENGKCGGEMAKAAEAIMDIAATPVSPELKKGQVTEDTIGPYARPSPPGP